MTATLEMLPELTWRRFGATTIDWETVLIVLAGALYLWGAWRVGRRTPGPGWHGRRTLAFCGGLVVSWVSVGSFIGVYGEVLFYDHMVQHLLLIMVAAGLFAMGAPVELAERATSGSVHAVVVRGLSSSVAEVVGHPLTGFLLYALLIPLSHLTSFYNLTLENGTIESVEHLAFIVIGYLFWRQVVAIEPSRHPLSPPVRLLYLAAAVPVDSFVGLALISASHELFPAYTQMHRTWGPSRLTDLHLGGAIMWVGGDSLMLLAMIPIVIQWIRAEEAKAIEVDRQLDQDRFADRRGQVQI